MLTRRVLASLAIALAVGLALPQLAGCDMVRKKLGCNWTDTISSPSDGDLEWPAYQIISAAMNPDEEAGWQQFRGAMHSAQIDSPAGETMLRTMNYPKTRRVVRLYTADDTEPTFQVCYTEEREEGLITVFILNEGSNMPTPCKMKQDPNANGAWRAYYCSL